MRTVEFNPLSISSLKAAVKQLEEEKKRLEVNTWMFTHDLADYAREEAQAGFDRAANAGPNPDVSVLPTKYKSSRSKAEITILASGTQTLFIEFGTGVLSNENWAERAELKGDPVAEHGQFGPRGADPTGWFYKKEYQGSAPRPEGTGESYLTGKSHLMHTVGQHAQSPLWNAKNKAREKAAEIAREVFDD